MTAEQVKLCRLQLAALYQATVKALEQTENMVKRDRAILYFSHIDDLLDYIELKGQRRED